MKHIIFESNESINFSEYKQLDQLLNYISTFSSVEDHMDKVVKTYTLNIDSLGEDLVIKVDHIENVELKIMTEISTYIYKHCFLVVKCKIHEHFKLKKIFNTYREFDGHVEINKLYQYMEKLPQTYLYEHKIDKIIKKYLNVDKVDALDAIKVYELMRLSKLFDLKHECIEDLELNKIILKHIAE